MRPLFALDQNFPTSIVAALEDFVLDAELVRVNKIDSRMSVLEDWELIVALHQHERPWGGLITTDSSMLSLPRVLAAIMQTRTTVVVAEDAGHDPIKATGLIFAHIGSIANKSRPEEPQVWTLRTKTNPATDPWELFTRVANHQNVSASALMRRSWLTETELAEDPLRRR